MNITAIIIDDERKAIFSLKSKIERKCPNITLIGETQSPKEGLKLIADLKPQLVFLDIAMPEMSGFDLLEQIKEPDFEIIFVTAFDEFAIRAINHSAIGYLLKPVNKVNLVEVVDRVIENSKYKTALKKNENLIKNLGIKSFNDKKIAISSVKGLDFVKVEDIIYCEGVTGYTKINFKNNESILSSRNLGYFKKILDDDSFFLVHKSYLINCTHIVKYLFEGYVVMSDHSNIPVSRTRRSDFLTKINNRT